LQVVVFDAVASARCCWCCYRRRFFSTRSTVAGLIISSLKVFNPSAYIFILMFFHSLSMKKLSVMESKNQVLSHELLGDGFVTLMSMFSFFGHEQLLISLH
jgi:hypothetical protein